MSDIEIDQDQALLLHADAWRQLARIVQALMASYDWEMLSPPVKVEVGNAVALLVKIAKQEKADGGDKGSDTV